MKSLTLILLGTTLAACSATPNLLPVNDLNRPTDMTFGCFSTTGDQGSLVVTGRPMEACHPQDLYDPAASTSSRTFAFMTESASGGLTVVDADHWKLVDLDPFTAGYGQAPLGELPSQISASQDGCRLITANRGSCDLSFVDPSVLVTPTFAALDSSAQFANPPPSPRTATLTIRPVKGDGTLLAAAPYEAVFLPQDTSSLFDITYPQATFQGCSADGAMVDPVGWPAQAKPAPWYAMVTYPSCDLVAVVALPGGQIVSSAFVRPTADGKSVTLVDAGQSPSCPVDCVGQALAPGAGTADASSPDASVAAPEAGSDAGGAGGADAAPDASPSSDGAAGAAGGAAAIDASAADASGAAGMPGSGGMAGMAGTGGTGGTKQPGIQYADNPYVASSGPVGPSGIEILPDGSRAYVALANASYVLSIGLTSSGLTLPANPIYLHEGALGSTRVRLNVDPYRQKTAGTQGVFVGADIAATGEVQDELTHGGAIPDPEHRQYLYAIARDGTVRVISVFLPGAETECEANLDPLNLPAGVSGTTACYPVDQDPDHLHRRPFSVGPGIHFPALPIDIASADIRTAPTEDTSEQSVNGAHAWVITDSGVVYLVNINPVLRQYTAAYETGPMSYQFTSRSVQEPEPFVNTLRDRNYITYSLTLDPSSGPPRLDVLPSIPASGPYIEPFWTQGAEVNPTATSNLFVATAAFFPDRPDIPEGSGLDPVDRRAVTPQTWTVAWEGSLTGNRATAVLLGTDTSAGRFPPGGQKLLANGASSGVDSLLYDGGTNYCSAGVVAGDLLTLTGCTGNGQCGLGEECWFDTSVSSAGAGLPVNGLCVDPNLADKQASSCAPFLQTVRRYTVVAAYPNQVVIRPHLDELARPAMTACDPSANGRTSMDVAMDPAYQQEYAPGSPTLALCPDPNDPTTNKFTCVSDPEGGTAPRCLQACDSMTPCRTGRICVSLGSGAAPPLATDCAKSQDCYCADAPPLTDDAKNGCFDQFTSYQVQVGGGFLVGGSQSGVMTTAALPPGDQQCSSNPSADPRFTFRIPLTAPLCTNVPDVHAIDGRISPDLVDTAQISKDTAQMNARTLSAIAQSTPTPSDPCLYWGGPVAGDTATSTTGHVRALFRNSQVSFVLANLDRGPSSQFTTSFDVNGGFGATIVQDPATIEVSMPARIVLGPVDAEPQLTAYTATSTEQRYLFVIDQRRLGLAQGGGPTRGQLLRIHPLGYTSTVGSATGTQPIFQDYTASGELFPIQ